MEELAAVYSRSLFAVALERGLLDVIREQLAQFADAVAGSRQLQTFLFSPYFSTQEKEAGLAQAIEGGEEILLNFLRLLIENHRMPVIFRIRRAFDALWEEEHKLLPVQITSAFELDERTTRQLGDQIGERTGRRVELTTHVEPEIIGGIVLRVGNSILDASIRNRLERLRKQVARGAAA
jgi:ATP synthase F1 delta subunit